MTTRINFPKREVALLVACAAMLGGCGGGSTNSSTGNATTTLTTGAVTTTTTTAATTTTTTLAMGATVTDFTAQSTTTAQSNSPITFGQVFAVGHLASGDTVTGKRSDGANLPLQVDIKARHADGSVRHAIISAILPQVGISPKTFELVKTTDLAATSNTSPAALLGNGFAANIDILLNGQTYSANASDMLQNGTVSTWLSGPVATEWHVTAALKTAGGATHPHLTAKYAIRYFPSLNQARVEVIIENNKTFAAAAQNFTYDVNVNVGGQSVYSQAALPHYHHARWRKVFWWGRAEPPIHLRHNAAYLIATRAVSNYDQTLAIPDSALVNLQNSMPASRVGPMKIGAALDYMPTGGGRPDIGPLPNWAVLYLLTQDKRAKDVMLATADGSGSWSIHYRDENTGEPVRLDNPVNRSISTHGNLAHLGPLPVPRCAPSPASCATPFDADGAHQPSLAYLPYLVTGDYYYLEELLFWNAVNPLGTAPGNHGYELGLLRWDQVRGQAWSMRTLGHAAYITPDAHPLKNYVVTQLGNNLNFYNQAYSVGKPNQLGVYDGSGAGAFMPNLGQTAAWQDDFFTWMTGYLVELGFTDAQPLRQWKSKYSVGRMTTPDFCWINASFPGLRMRSANGAPVFTTFKEIQDATFADNAMVNDDGTPVTHPQGVPYSSLACASQAQADWWTAVMGWTWQIRRMRGYADSTIGYPANMQSALAIAADAGIPNAAEAWALFQTRGAKPNYAAMPTWAIVPRN